MARAVLAAVLALAAAGAGAQPPAPGDPLAAADWLTDRASRAASGWRPGDPRPAEVAGRPAPVAATGAVGPVQVRVLGAADGNGAGLVAPAQAGLPAGLWDGVAAAEAAAALAAVPVRLPAMTDLLRRLLVARMAPPARDPAAPDGWLLARIDRLLALGDLAGAAGLIAAAGPAGADDPQAAERAARAFDVALLAGGLGRACALPGGGQAAGLEARIVCLAQGGDWPAAALLHRIGAAQGVMAAASADRLAQFLDDAAVDDAGQGLTPPDPPTPLAVHLHAAIGQPLPTGPLPLVFAHADLRGQAGLKARIEAAERLVRAGILPASGLRAAYAEGTPAASGGVWDRARAVAALDAAVAANDAAAGAAALDRARAVFEDAGLGAVLAVLAGPILPAAWPGAGALRAFAGTEAKTAPAAPPPAPGRGLALLAAMGDVDAGLGGDATRAARGLAALRALGLASDAARAEAQLAHGPALMGRG